jgi:hypothetical protein
LPHTGSFADSPGTLAAASLIRLSESSRKLPVTGGAGPQRGWVHLLGPEGIDPVDVSLLNGDLDSKPKAVNTYGASPSIHSTAR